MSKNKGNGFEAGQVKRALLHGMTVESKNGWIIRVNDSDDVEVWPPKGEGFSTHIGMLDKAVQDFCKTADMPIPGVNMYPDDQVDVPEPSALLGSDSAEGEGFDNPSVNKRPKGLDAEGTDAPSTELGSDTTSDSAFEDPDLNRRPTSTEGTGGKPDTDLGQDMSSRPTNWGERTISGRHVRRAAPLPADAPDKATSLSGFGDMLRRELRNLDTSIQVEEQDDGTVLVYDANFDAVVDPFTAVSELQAIAPGSDETAVWDALNTATSEAALRSARARHARRKALHPVQKGKRGPGMPGRGKAQVGEEAPSVAPGVVARREAADPFNVTPVEEPGKKPNKGETPSDPDEVVSTSYSKPRDEKYETEGETDKIGGREEHDGAYQDEEGKWMTDEDEKNVPEDWEGIAQQPKSKAGRIADTYLDPVPDSSSIYRELRRARPSAALLEDIMDPHKWAANNVFAQSKDWTPEETPIDQGKMSENRGRLTRKRMPVASKKVAVHVPEDQVEYDYEAEPDYDFAPDFMSGDPEYEAEDRKMEEDAKRRLDQGDIWAWFMFRVIATWKDSTGKKYTGTSNYLGGNSYASEEDFRRDFEAGEFTDMKDDAYENLMSQVEDADTGMKAIRPKGARRSAQEAFDLGGEAEGRMDDESIAEWVLETQELTDWAVEEGVPEQEIGDDDSQRWQSFLDEHRGELLREIRHLEGSRQADAPKGKGWERVTKDLKKEPGVDNPYALANWMKGQNYKPREQGGGKDARRTAGPKIREHWHGDGGYERGLEAESAEELHALTMALGGDEVDWSRFKPKQPEGAPAEVEAQDVPAPSSPTSAPAPTAKRRADVGGEVEAVDEGAKDYWQGYMGEYGKDLSKGDTTSKKPEKGRFEHGGPKKKNDVGIKARREAYFRARRLAQMAAPQAQPAAPLPAPGGAPGGAPVPAAPGGAPAPTGGPKPPAAAPGGAAPGLPAGTGDSGLQALGWTAEEIGLMDDEDKQKILQIKLKKPGTKAKTPAPGAPKPGGPGAGPGAPPGGPGAPAPSSPTAPGAGPAGPGITPPSPGGALMSPSAAARLANLILRKINRRRLLGQQVQPQQQAPAAPAAPAPAPKAPAAPAEQGAGPEFNPPPGTPASPKAPAAPGAGGGGQGMSDGVGDEVSAFKILSEIQGQNVSATTAEQVPALKASIFAQRLLTELGITVSEAYDLFGLSRSKSLTSLFK